MALPLYLAMTAAEMTGNPVLPPHFAYMACHFSPYGRALSNCPRSLPSESVLVVDDVTPIFHHDPELIVQQLESMLRNAPDASVLLDFQRPGYEEAQQLARHLTEVLPCPTAVSALYAEQLSCPVFLPPAPPDVPIQVYLSPWKNREIWLEAALDAIEIRLSEAESRTIPLSGVPDGNHFLEDRHLHCHYRIQLLEEEARFTLFRTPEDLDALMQEAESLGVSRAVGLWQELK